ncbi:MAG: adenylate kinase [Clostridia bacterium]|nr:adenylate kinase [Clostridia bacterium]
MVIIMLGAPGTGKGTVAGTLSKKLEIPQVSTGDIFRKAVAEKTPVGIEAEKYMTQGKLVPDDVTIRIVEERLIEKDVENGIILDGFPRTIEQAEALDAMLEKHNKKVDLAINLETPEEEIVERIVTRRVCSNADCKTVYNIKLSPSKIEGVCDKCGADLIQRKDDNEETVKNRLKTYFEQSAPIVEFYKNKDVLYSSLVSEKINKMAIDVAQEVYEMLKNN